MTAGTSEDIGRRLRRFVFGDEGVVYLIVAKPAPSVHTVVDAVDVGEGTGFLTDHDRKSFYNGQRMPGRQVSAITREFCDAAGIDPVRVGDNLVTSGVNLSELNHGARLQIGDEVILERSLAEHRPCALFSERAGAAAFSFARERKWRGALFTVVAGGSIVTNDRIVLIRAMGFEQPGPGQSASPSLFRIPEA